MKSFEHAECLDTVTVVRGNETYTILVERITKTMIICLDRYTFQPIKYHYAEKFNRRTGKAVGDYNTEYKLISVDKSRN